MREWSDPVPAAPVEEPPVLTRPWWRRWWLPLTVVVLALSALVGVLVWQQQRGTVLERAARACTPQGQTGLAGVEIADSGDTLILRASNEEYANVNSVVCVLRRLDTPEAVVQHVDTTRALDGQQTDEWDGVKARWTYHPEAGLQMVIERRR